MTPHGLFMYSTEINIFTCSCDIWLYRIDKASHCTQGLLSAAALLKAGLFLFLLFVCLTSLRLLQHHKGLEAQY